VHLTSEYVFQGEWIFYGMHSTSTTQQNEHVHDFVIGTEVHKITTSNNRAYRFLCATYKTLCGSRVYCQGKRVNRWDRGSGVVLVYLAPQNPTRAEIQKLAFKNAVSVKNIGVTLVPILLLLICCGPKCCSAAMYATKQTKTRYTLNSYSLY
jgi:hypothetical protein